MTTTIIQKQKVSFRALMLGSIAILAVPTITLAQGKWVAPSSADNVKNPNAGNANAAKEGKTLYLSYCTPCHGERGKGDGVAGGALSPKPANHTSAVVQGQSDGALFWKITEGRGPMASYKASLTDKQRWNLVSFIRTLKK